MKSVRIPEDLDGAMEYVAKAEKIEKAQSLRKLARMGFEAYVAREYCEARLTLREGAKLLGLSLSETMDLFAQLGVSGNVRVQEVLLSLRTARR